MDDFFGNMSGNPYDWRELYSRLAGENEIGNVTADATTSESGGHLSATILNSFMGSRQPVVFKLV